MERDLFFVPPGHFYSPIVGVRERRDTMTVGPAPRELGGIEVNERVLDNRCQLTFIDPFPRTLRALVSEADLWGRLIAQPVQSLSLSIFEALEPGDVLFIDSTHVCRAGSDVNFLLFDVLPALRAGVLIHVHDIFYPFEYPPEWIRQGRGWNEAYALRAFLEFNTAFRILLSNSFLELFHRPWFAEHMPLCLEAPIPTGSIWLEKVA
ncbi:MAG: class I SAM-dependent methyltransferase [Actinobacteria bacterium]|nr:class I SAM-dependent methyltransferase [Actinomycetota bacterium]